MLMRCTRDKGVFYADTKKQDAGKEIPSPLLLALRHRFVRNLNKKRQEHPRHHEDPAAGMFLFVPYYFCISINPPQQRLPPKDLMHLIY